MTKLERVFQLLRQARPNWRAMVEGPRQIRKGRDIDRYLARIEPGIHSPSYWAVATTPEAAVYYALQKIGEDGI